MLLALDCILHNQLFREGDGKGSRLQQAAQEAVRLKQTMKDFLRESPRQGDKEDEPIQDEPVNEDDEESSHEEEEDQPDNEEEALSDGGPSEKESENGEPLRNLLLGPGPPPKELGS